MVSQIHTHISEVFNSDRRNVQKVVPSLVQKKNILQGAHQPDNSNMLGLNVSNQSWYNLLSMMLVQILYVYRYVLIKAARGGKSLDNKMVCVWAGSFPLPGTRSRIEQAIGTQPSMSL